MPIRLGVLAFVSGVGLLQWQADLPAMYSLLVLLPLLGAVIMCWCSQKTILNVTSQYLFLLLLFGCGFFWAAGMAHWRLADSLPTVWEGRDIQITGVVSSLPQQNDRRIRFNFDVEQILTPHAQVPKRLSLSWYPHGAAGNENPALPVI